MVKGIQGGKIAEVITTLLGYSITDIELNPITRVATPIISTSPVIHPESSQQKNPFDCLPMKGIDGSENFP